MIKKADYDFPSPQWDNISDMAKDLISRLLVVDPKKRLTAEEMLKHPWIMGEKTPRKGLPEVSNKIREYNLKEKVYSYEGRRQVQGGA